MEDRYELQGKIGQGGIGSVHRAYDHKLKRQVAIKRILTSSEDPTLQDEATKQLMQESSALASLQHPHIVTILDVGLDSEGPYVVMELINGKTLDEIIDSAPLAWQDFKQVAEQSLEALIAAQEMGMIHSDLKPPNIMLTWLPSGTFQVKIVDFGLAVLVQNQSQEEIEKMEAVFGSIFFMPPEQFERKTLDARSDLYSLGCCFYQALAGEYPFNGETGTEVMDSHLNHNVKPIQEWRSDIPEWACQWVMWLINRYPDDRPESAREALKNFTQNDKRSKTSKTQGQAQSKHQRLIIPSINPEIAGQPATIPTAPVQTSIPATSQVSQQPTGSALTAAQQTAALTAAQKTAAPAASAGGSRPSRNHMKIVVAAAAVLLLALLAVFLKQRNDRIRREYVFHEFVAKAAENSVQTIPISGNDLDIVLDLIAKSEPNVNLSPVCKALSMATSSDGSHLNTKIASFITGTDLADKVRQKLFENVIANRADSSVTPIVIQYATIASDEGAGKAAVMSIRSVVTEEHAPGLLRIITSTNHAEVREAAKTLMEDIIVNADNPSRLQRLITRSDTPTISGGARRAINHLLDEVNPREKINTPSPAVSNTPKESTPPRETTPTRNIAPPEKKPAPKQVTASSTAATLDSIDPNSAPPELDSVIKDLSSSDPSRVTSAISTLGNASHAVAHGALLNFSGRTNGSDIYDRAIDALIKLNSHPEMVDDGEFAKQRWLQLIWRAKETEQRKKAIDALEKIQTDWAIDHLKELTANKDDATAQYARQALMNISDR